MEIEPGKCVRCGRKIADDGRPLPIYSEIECETDGGDRVRIGACIACSFEAEDAAELDGAVRRSIGDGVGRIVSVVDRKGYGQILLELQGNVCPLCGEGIADRWVVNAGRAIHERCPRIRVLSDAVELRRNPEAGKGRAHVVVR